jgi:hypothetical protein
VVGGGLSEFGWLGSGSAKKLDVSAAAASPVSEAVNGEKFSRSVSLKVIFWKRMKKFNILKILQQYHFSR